MKKDAYEWLRGFLRDGPKEVAAIREAAKNAGYTKGELREAKMICGIRTTNNRSAAHLVTDKWFWELPEVKE